MDLSYFPVPESQGGWRYLNGPEEIRTAAGMEPRKLELFCRNHEFVYGGDSWSVAIIRHGWLVKEIQTFNVANHSRFDIWSGTKSFTGTAWGLLLDDSRNGKLPPEKAVDLESFAYKYIPEGYPLTDALKEKIKVKHLLSMTSGLPGESTGILGMPTAVDSGPFECALGKTANRFGLWAGKLTAEPGSRWDYSDVGMCHLALMFSHITGREMEDYLRERVLDPIGIENLSWDIQGGSGFMGPHTNPHTGIHISARELARFGYLMLNKGKWEDRQLIPEGWVDLATASSQQLNPDYGYTWWVNTNGTCWPGLPRDMFALMGYRSNKCYIIPSLDLIVARVGSGPVTWYEQGFINGIVDTVLDR